MTRKFFWLFAAIGVAAILIQPTFAEDAPPSIIGATDQAQLQRIEKGLMKKVDIDFVDTPLKEALTQLFAADETPFYIDERALDLLGIGDDTPVTLKNGGLRVDQTLDLLLRPLELDWMPNRGLVKITSPEEVNVNLTTVVYDVDVLMLPDGHASSLISCVMVDLHRDLTDLIQRTVSPESWECLGGAGTIEAWHLGDQTRLVIRQTYHEHKQIERFLHDLKTSLAAAKPPEEADDSLSHRVYPLNIDDERFQTDEVEKLIRAAMPDRWNDKTTIVAAAGTLIINQTSATHKEITSLLDQLGALADSSNSQSEEDWNGRGLGGGFGDAFGTEGGGEGFGGGFNGFDGEAGGAGSNNDGKVEPAGGNDPFGEPSGNAPSDPNDPFAPAGGDPFGG